MQESETVVHELHGEPDVNQFYPAFHVRGSFNMMTPALEMQHFITMLQAMILLKQGATLAFTSMGTAQPDPTAEPANAPDGWTTDTAPAVEPPKRKRRTNAEIVADELAAKIAAEQTAKAEVWAQTAADLEAAAQADAAAVAALEAAPEAAPVKEVTLDELRVLGADVMRAHGSQKLVDALFTATGQRALRALTSQAQNQAAYAAFRALLA